MLQIFNLQLLLFSLFVLGIKHFRVLQAIHGHIFDIFPTVRKQITKAEESELQFNIHNTNPQLPARKRQKNPVVTIEHTDIYRHQYKSRNKTELKIEEQIDLRRWQFGFRRPCE